MTNTGIYGEGKLTSANIRDINARLDMASASNTINNTKRLEPIVIEAGPLHCKIQGDKEGVTSADFYGTTEFNLTVKKKEVKE